MSRFFLRWLFVEEQLFERLVDLETQKAVWLGYYLSVVCFMPNLPSAEANPRLATELARTAIRQLRAMDVATTFARGPSTSVGLLLIDAELQDLPRIFNRLKPDLEAHVTDHGRQEGRLTKPSAYCSPSPLPCRGRGQR